MRALTVWQPWASLIAVGAKPYEFRSWPAPAWIVGQRIAIHAGVRKPKRGEIEQLRLICRTGKGRRAGLFEAEALPILEHPEALWFGAIVCTAVVGEPIHASTGLPALGIERNDSDRREHFNWAWPLTDVARLAPPVPARGAQGFWNWNGGESDGR